MLLEVTAEEARFIERLRRVSALGRQWQEDWNRTNEPVDALCRLRDVAFPIETTTAAQRMAPDGPWAKMQQRIFEEGCVQRKAMEPLNRLKAEAYEGFLASVKEVGLWGYDFTDDDRD